MFREVFGENRIERVVRPSIIPGWLMYCTWAVTANIALGYKFWI